MELYSLFLIAIWLLPIWIYGWILLPITRHIFPTLPDGGLAAGRLLYLMLVSLLLFWTASLHLIPLTISCWILPLAPPLLLLIFTRNASRISEFRCWVISRRKALILSDIVFAASFLFFIYLRLCQPEIREQEKPMDSAIIGVLARILYLPSDNPWFSGTSFTNYYYFGHFMAASLKRVFFTPLPYAYNLIQPVFCAFFLSILWSLCSAVAHSPRAGLMATSFIAIGGNCEPLRQLLGAWRNHQPLWPLDWWSTSRVVPNTINEYPFFTLALGDAHAHFFGMSLGVLLLCLLHGLSQKTKQNKAQSIQIQVIQLLVAGSTLGCIIMTNAWDAPLYFGLGAFLIFVALKKQSLSNGGSRMPRAYITSMVAIWLAIPVFCAVPFLADFRSPVRGIGFEFWLPGCDSWWHWASFAGAFCVMLTRPEILRQIQHKFDSYNFLLAAFGCISIVLPLFICVKGYFDGELRHQDTIFKFWLQGWLVLGIPLFSFLSKAFIDCGSFVLSKKPLIPCGKRQCLVQFRSINFNTLICIILLMPFLGFVVVTQARIQTGAKPLSLNGSQFLTPSDQAAIAWLNKNAALDSTLIEAVGQNPGGSMIGAYTILVVFPSSPGFPQN